LFRQVIDHLGEDHPQLIGDGLEREPVLARLVDDRGGDQLQRQFQCADVSALATPLMNVIEALPRKPRTGATRTIPATG
jgi:hypothetical protein